MDVDLEKFFDRVNHDILIDRLSKRINDVGVIRHGRVSLNSGIMINGVVNYKDERTPQGGPLSPLLVNIMPDEGDKELESRSNCVSIYVDDYNFHVVITKGGEGGESTLIH